MRMSERVEWARQEHFCLCRRVMRGEIREGRTIGLLHAVECLTGYPEFLEN
jgi:hypothetical protein